MYHSVLITGANRGIGLEFVQQFTAQEHPPHLLFATCRNPDGAKVSFYSKKNTLLHTNKYLTYHGAIN